MTALPAYLSSDAPSAHDEEAFRWLIDQLANDLCRSVDGDFDYIIDIRSQDPVFQKLRMLVNATLDAARQGIASIQAEKVRIENEQHLIAQRDQARAAAQTKASFLANMSHEIRTPMHGILGMCELLLDTGLTDAQEKLLTTLLDSARALLRILNDILDMSKLEAGRVTLEQIAYNLPEVVERVYDLKAVQAQKKQLGFEVHIDPHIQHLDGDPYRLRQVLINLLGNAIKFTPRGRICLDVSLHPQPVPDLGDQPAAMRHPLKPHDSGWLSLRVCDTGIGMDHAAQQQLFQTFGQLDASITRRFGGTGLGLAITREVVSLMGGAITVRSQPDQGSTFTVWLPYHPSQEACPKVSASLHNTTVLVADASQTNRQNTRQLLERHGAQVIEATQAQDVLLCVQQGLAQGCPIDLILMDADLSAHDVLTQLGERLAHAVPPVLMAVDDDNPSAWPAAVTGLLIKPFDRGQLLEQVERLLSHPDRQPRRAVSATPSDRIHSSPSPARHLRVLMADDNPINRLTAEGMAKDAVQHWVMVEDGQAALEALAAEPFDLVLMDIQMPRMSGLEAIAQLRRQDSVHRTLPIVALTANAMVTDRERFLSAGFSDYLSKPFRRADLLALFDKWAHRQAPSSDSSPRSTPTLTPEQRSRPASEPVCNSSTTAPLPLFDAQAFQENFSVFTPDEQIEMLQQARQQLLEEREKLHRHVALEAFDLAQRAAHKLVGGMGAMCLSALSQAARRLMHALHEGQHAQRLAQLKLFEQQAQLALDRLADPHGLLADALPTESTV